MVAEKKSFKDFESALLRLEEITEKLESGETPLEQALLLYTEGLEIAGFCSRKLAEAEKKVTVLKEKNRQLVEETFAVENESGEIENER